MPSLKPLTKIQKLKVKVNTWSIKLLKHVQPFSGIYLELAYQLQDINTLSTCIESVAISIKHLVSRIQEIEKQLKIVPPGNITLPTPDKTKLN